MKPTTQKLLWATFLAGTALCIATPSFADDPHPQSHPHGEWHGARSGGGPGWGRGGGHRNFVAFGHTDFAHFSPAQRTAWVGGRWNHGWHNGHFGWWWFAGGAWYFYGAPIYPYPEYISDEYVVDDSDDGGYPAGPTWYYCQNPPGYYPYVQQCSSPWQPVPATPPPPQGYGPPPPGYGRAPQGYGPPPGADQGPPPDGDQGPPPGDDRYPDYQGPPPGGPPPGSNQGPPPGPPPGPQNG